jgi:transcription antitermination factor NusG
MQRNWYLICTKKQQEKRVTELLAKKGVENYCPFTIMESKISGTKKITVSRPLFNGYVFVHITEDEIQSVKKTPYITNMVYWKSKPVVVSEQEISTVKMMTENYHSIKLEKTAVGTLENFYFSEQNITTQHNNVFSIKHKGHAAVLPSLGYKISAQRERTEQKTLPKITAPANTLLKKLNPLFLFGF